MLSSEGVFSEDDQTETADIHAGFARQPPRRPPIKRWPLKPEPILLSRYYPGAPRVGRLARRLQHAPPASLQQIENAMEALYQVMTPDQRRRAKAQILERSSSQMLIENLIFRRFRDWQGPTGVSQRRTVAAPSTSNSESLPQIASRGLGSPTLDAHHRVANQGQTGHPLSHISSSGDRHTNLYLGAIEVVTRDR